MALFRGQSVCAKWMRQRRLEMTADAATRRFKATKALEFRTFQKDSKGWSRLFSS
jgi:hypothetical protein